VRSEGNTWHLTHIAPDVWAYHVAARCATPDLTMCHFTSETLPAYSACHHIAAQPAHILGAMCPLSGCIHAQVQTLHINSVDGGCLSTHTCLGTHYKLVIVLSNVIVTHHSVVKCHCNHDALCQKLAGQTRQRCGDKTVVGYAILQ
jgi:hypothetical protein